MPPRRARAVLETSFWTVAHRADVAANCLDLFEMVVPRAVEAEIRAVQASAPRREYPYSTLFRHLRGQMLDPPEQGPPPIPLFGAGEAEAIALADQLRLALLINEYRGMRYADDRGIQVVTVSDVIGALRALDIISDRAARRKLALITPNTARTVVRRAVRTLDRL